jgi:hypothetical protein
VSTKGIVSLGDKSFANYNIVTELLKLPGGLDDFTPILLVFIYLQTYFGVDTPRSYAGAFPGK